MPFLISAKAVTVIAVNEQADETSSDQLVGHLARHGIGARIQRLAVERGDIQGAILSIAAESNMGLLAMGGYGHSPLRERKAGSHGACSVRRPCHCLCRTDLVPILLKEKKHARTRPTVRLPSMTIENWASRRRWTRSVKSCAVATGLLPGRNAVVDVSRDHGA